MFIESGPARVIESGMVTTFDGNGLTLVLDLDGDHLVVELVFEVGETSVIAEETPVGVRLRCVGLGEAVGRGSAEPVPLGEIDGDALFLHFRVFRVGRTADPTVHYTFFRVAGDPIREP